MFWGKWQRWPLWWQVHPIFGAGWVLGRSFSPFPCLQAALELSQLSKPLSCFEEFGNWAFHTLPWSVILMSKHFYPGSPSLCLTQTLYALSFHPMVLVGLISDRKIPVASLPSSWARSHRALNQDLRPYLLCDPRPLSELQLSFSLICKMRPIMLTV